MEQYYYKLNLRRMRRLARLSGRRLARQTGLGYAIIYRLEKKGGNPRINTILKITREIDGRLRQGPEQVVSELIPDSVFEVRKDVLARAKQAREDELRAAYQD